MNKQEYARYGNHFVASDIHFNHKNVPVHCPQSRGQFIRQVGVDPATNAPVYDNLIQEMNETIVAKWNAKIGPKDHTFILGDVAMGRIDDAPQWIKRLNGAKTLIRGNHDRTLMRVCDGLFVDIRDYLCFSPPSHKPGVVMSHFPFWSWDGMGHGAIMLHGHLHSPVDRRHVTEHRIMDVGIDGNNLTPYDFDEVCAYVATRPMPKYDHHGKDL